MHGLSDFRKMFNVSSPKGASGANPDLPRPSAPRAVFCIDLPSPRPLPVSGSEHSTPSSAWDTTKLGPLPTHDSLEDLALEDLADTLAACASPTRHP